MGRYPAVSPIQSHSGDGPFAGEEADVANQLYQHYYARLMAVATTRYRWVGLGAHIDPLRVEWLLVNFGLAAFTFVNHNQGEPQGVFWRGPLGEDEHYSIWEGRFTITQAQVTGFLDDTFTPASYRTYAPTGANGKAFSTFGPMEQWAGVPIWGDANRSQYDMHTINTFARRLARASLVVDTNLVMTMRGAVVVTDSDNLKSDQVSLAGIKRGVDVFTTKKGTIADTKAIDLGVHPDTVEKSHIIAMRLWSEALEALGVESPAAEKGERLINAEVGADNSQVAAVRRLTLEPRQQAASLINRRFFEGEPVVECVDQWK